MQHVRVRLPSGFGDHHSKSTASAKSTPVHRNIADEKGIDADGQMTFNNIGITSGCVMAAQKEWPPFSKTLRNDVSYVFAHTLPG